MLQVQDSLFENLCGATYCDHGYCYHLVIVIIWLLLSFGYCYHSVIVIIWLLLSFGYCYHSVIVIIWLFGLCHQMEPKLSVPNYSCIKVLVLS
jgi:hypothetical protein